VFRSHKLSRVAGLLILSCLPFTMAADGPPAPTPTPAPSPAPAPPVPNPNVTPPGFRELTAPSANKVRGLELPPNQEISSKKRFIVLTAKTDDPTVQVRWVVSNSVPQSPLSILEAPASKTILIFPNDHADMIFVLCYTVVNGDPSDPAVTAIKVNGTPFQPTPGPGPSPGPGPNPGPGPAPKPPAPAVTGNLHVTAIIDYGQQTPDLADMRTSKAFRDSLTQLNAEYHEYGAMDYPADMKKYVTAAGGPPVVIVQDDSGFVIDKAYKIANANDVLTLVTKLRGK
jgi:hypothetical protein